MQKQVYPSLVMFDAAKKNQPVMIRPVWGDNSLSRRVKSELLKTGALLATLAICAVLVFLLVSIVQLGADGLTLDFFNNYSSRFASRSGIRASLIGSLYLSLMTAAIAIPLGVGTAVFLEEFSRDSKLRRVVDINIANLAGIPSIIFGMLGLAVFVRALAFGGSILSGAMTMSLLVLPVIVTVTREALKNVPESIRLAAFALGAGQWQTIKAHVLSAATPGIMTGIILALARALGETAPLILVGAVTYIAFVPESPMDSYSVLPLQIYNWTSKPQEDFHQIAASGIIVLLAVILLTNALAVFIRYRTEKKNKW